MSTPSIFTSIINSYLPEPQASLLNGIIFGINLKTTKAFYTELKTVGLLHLVVLSGQNITLLSAIIAKITEFFGKQISLVLTILILIFFVMFVGPQAPIIRATFMGVLTLVAIIYGKKNTVLYTLFLSLIFIAIFWPKWLTTVSLQLSYGATLGIIFFGPKKKRGYVVDNLQMSLAAQIFTAPIIFFHFREISLISPLANICVAWLIVPLMLLGFATALLGKLNFVLGILPGYIAYGLLTYMVWVVNLLSKIPGAYFKF